MDDEHLGRRIKRLREAADMTKAELRRLSGVPYDTIAKLEAEKQASTSTAHLAALAKVLGDQLLPDGIKQSFAEPQEPFADAAQRILNEKPPTNNPLTDEPIAGGREQTPSNEIKFALVGRFAHIVATVDKDGIQQLRSKLDAIEAILDD